MSPVPVARGAPRFRAVACIAIGLAAASSAAGVFAAPPSAPPPAERPKELAPRPGRFVATPDTFASSLRQRLEGEARRQRLADFMPVAVAGYEEPDDSTVEEGGRRAGRVILRSLRGALDERLEAAARDSASFGPLFRWIDTRSEGGEGARISGPERFASGVGVTAPAAGAGTGAAGEAPDAGDLSFGFRLDAHPRLLLGMRRGSLEGRLELPVLEREIRLSLDRPLGERGRASLRGGHSEDRGGWADLAIRFSF